MNNDLQAIMARQRRRADNEKKGEDAEEEMSIADLKRGGKKKKKEKEDKKEQEKSKDNLQAIMDRRRRLADGEKVEDKQEEAKKEPEKSKETEKNPLKEIMDRRRRIADGESQPEPQLQQPLTEPKSPASGPASEKGTLKDIMERRRKLADGEIAPSSLVRANSSDSMEKLSLAPPGAGLSLAPPQRPNLAPAPVRHATVAPIRQELKHFGMTLEVKQIMERRRKLAEATNFVDEDEDSDDDEEGGPAAAPAAGPELDAVRSAPSPSHAVRSSFSPSRRTVPSVSPFAFGGPPVPASPKSRPQQLSTFSLKPASRPPPPPVQSTGASFSLAPQKAAEPSQQQQQGKFSLRPAPKEPPQTQQQQAPTQTTSFSLKPKEQELFLTRDSPEKTENKPAEPPPKPELSPSKEGGESPVKLVVISPQESPEKTATDLKHESSQSLELFDEEPFESTKEKPVEKDAALAQTEKILEPESPEEETIQPESPEEETIQPESPAEETIQPESPAEETIQPESPEEETIQPESPEEETMQPEPPAEETMQPELPAEETMQPEPPAEETMQPEPPAEETMQPELPAKETKQPELPVKETKQPELPVKETKQPEPRIETEKKQEPKTAEPPSVQDVDEEVEDEEVEVEEEDEDEEDDASSTSDTGETYADEEVPKEQKTKPKKPGKKKDRRGADDDEPAEDVGPKKPARRKKRVGGKKQSPKGKSLDDDQADGPSSSPTGKSKKSGVATSLATALSGRRLRGRGGDEKSVTSAQSSSSAGECSKTSLTTEDITRAPSWDARNEYPGGKADGKISVFQRKGKGVAAQWSTETESWVEIGEVAVASASSTASMSNEDSPVPAPSPEKPRRKKGDAKHQRRQKPRLKGIVDEPSYKKSTRRADSASEDEDEEEAVEEAKTPPPLSRKKKNAEQPLEESLPVASAFDSAWGDVPAFGSAANTHAASDAFGGSTDFSSAFMSDFGDGAFGKSGGAFSADAFQADSKFEDAFATGTFDPSGNVFAQTPQEPVYDTTPLTKMPSLAVGRMELEQRKVMKCQFQGQVATNPLNGNLIFSSTSRDGAVLREVDTTRGNLQVMSASILTPELRTKVANKYNATVRGLDEVIRVVAGLHEAGGLVRVRVAAIIHLRVLETQQPLRVVAVWQWGYGYPQPVALQFIMSPPSGGDFSYDPFSILVADSLVFLAGQSPKGPCVFISKPSLRESWTSNSLSGSGKVSAMEVLMTVDRSRPYLAVALTDKSISVWTYMAAVEISLAKGKEQTKRWLFPLCRLECAKILGSLDAHSYGADGKPTGNDAKSIGYCTHLAWLNEKRIGSSMLLIAASYQNALAVFHVGLPVLGDKTGVKPLPEPTSGSSLSSSPRLWPIVAKRWQGKHDRCMSSWVDLGPYVNPCLSLLLQPSDSKFSLLALGIINIPQFRRGPMPKEKVLPFKILANGVVVAEQYPASILPSTGRGTVFCQSDDFISQIVPHVPEDASGTSISSLWYPICSQPPGISSLGDPLLEANKSDKDGIVHIFSTLQCERNRAESDGKIFDWSRPTRRHWICRTVLGDTKSSSVDETKEEKTTSQFGDGETVLGGASSDIVCEIYDEALVGCTPMRIIRCPDHDDLYAILFRPSLCSKSGVKEGLSLDATSVAFIDRSESASAVQVLDARDAVFLPGAPGDLARGLILNKDGLGLTYFTWAKNEQQCQLHTTYRPILGVEAADDYVECKRIFVSAGSSNISLLAAGTRLRDLRTVVVCGELVEQSSLSPNGWSSILPNIVTGRSAWLNSLEDVITLVGLEGDDSGYRNFSMVTSLRVLILSSAMEVAAECRTTMVESASLAPLGAFAVAFVAAGKLRYLCCLDGELMHGTIATLASGNRTSPFLLLAVRQDRFIGTYTHVGVRLVELGQKMDAIFLPTALTSPVLLLEPLVANAVSIGGKQNQSTAILRNIIEKFGRLVPLAHGDGEGIGNLGSGLTARVFQILDYYGLKHAASWLLTGIVQFDRSASTTLLPPWLPVTARVRGALNMDAVLHILASGDQYLSDYVKNPDGGIAAALPRQTDSISYLSRDIGVECLRHGRAIDALKTLDLVGCESMESMIVQLSLLLGKDGTSDPCAILSLISGYGERGTERTPGEVRLPSSVAAVALFQRNARMRGVELAMNSNDIDRWMKPLAPSLQKGGRLRRIRQRLIGDNALAQAGEKKDTYEDQLFTTPCKEAKHVWNEGPNREKDKLLMLDRIEDWVGRRRPVILGKEGASAARDRGALANILDMDENSIGGKSDLEDDQDGGWVDGVGEGRSDEANLSGYFRFSEGDIEEGQWRADGFLDLSPYQVKATLYGGADSFSLQPSTSSVDEGEAGKVKSLFDLVFDNASVGALVVPAPRGGSCDVGVLHSSDRQSRQKCTIEFWYNLPSSKPPSDDIVLARRTFGPSGDDFSKAAMVSDKDCMLWELALKPSGELVFRSCGGTSLRSTQNQDLSAGSYGKERPDLVQFGKWNHVCVVLSSRGLGLTECTVSIFMMGNAVAEEQVSMLPSGFDEDDLVSAANLKELLQKSNILFGLGNPKEFRMTELRIWACSRSEDDINTFMREYLNAAEGKKKFKVKIKSKKGLATLGKGNFITKGAVGADKGPTGLLSLAPTPKMSLAPQKKSEETQPKREGTETGFASDFNAFGVSESGSGSPRGSPEKPVEEEPPVTLWDTALPLSQQVRSSAAAALIRGPPATRHFGGNRGGLPDFSGMERFGVGGIAICGSEKTIVWRDNEDPPALTYPIGASGAIVSDQMDDEGSEFLCCFLARDKRMVVFELQSRTVVVELQMTTKLNFWRFLPPEAGENTLCFMLVTPVGGFHWMPLDESPRPQQVWKRGPDLAGKKVVSYEEGGSNGLDGPDILSRVGFIMVTKASGESTLESWIVPIAGDSVAVQVSDDVMGGCLCLPPYVDEGPFLPLLVAVLQIEEGIFVNVMSLVETQPGSVGLGEIAVTLEVDLAGFEAADFEPPSLAMGTFPEAICCSLANIVVVLIRRKGLIVAFELEDGDMSLIAREGVDHYVIDAVMRYSAEVGGAEIVMLLADDENPKDGRMVSFCFRSAA